MYNFIEDYFNVLLLKGEEQSAFNLYIKNTRQKHPEENELKSDLISKKNAIDLSFLFLELNPYARPVMAASMELMKMPVDNLIKNIRNYSVFDKIDKEEDMSYSHAIMTVITAVIGFKKAKLNFFQHLISEVDKEYKNLLNEDI